MACIDNTAAEYELLQPAITLKRELVIIASSPCIELMMLL